MNAIPLALSNVRLGLETSVKGLTMFPLLARGDSNSSEEHAVETRAPLTLDDALASGWARITELSDSGSVPELRFVNTGPQPVFILDGEELVGAKQNRIVNLSMLVPPACTLTIPVSCVEAGRWHARSRSFAAAPRVQYAAGRAKRTQQVTVAMMNMGARVSDQGAVWEDIAAKARRMDAFSETSAMEAMFTQHEGSIDEFVEGLAPVPGQVGALFLVGGQIAGLDLFGSAVLLRKLLPKIVRSHALDAIDPGLAGMAGGKRKGNGAAQRAAAEQFLECCGAAEVKEMPAVGLGVDVRVTGTLTVPRRRGSREAETGRRRGDARITGAALVHEDRVVHLDAFVAAL